MGETRFRFRATLCSFEPPRAPEPPHEERDAIPQPGIGSRPFSPLMAVSSGCWAGYTQISVIPYSEFQQRPEGRQDRRGPRQRQLHPGHAEGARQARGAKASSPPASPADFAAGIREVPRQIRRHRSRARSCATSCPGCCRSLLFFGALGVRRSGASRTSGCGAAA